jgi:hypothetical protein
MKPRITTGQRNQPASVLDELDKDEIIRLAYEFMEECEQNKVDQATAKGVVQVKSRKLPTPGYFCDIWLRKRGINFYKSRSFYDVRKDETHPAYKLVTEISGILKSLAVDVVANEGKGIFYAKNHLDMTDKVENNTNVNTITVKYE